MGNTHIIIPDSKPISKWHKVNRISWKASDIAALKEFWEAKTRTENETGDDGFLLEDSFAKILPWGTPEVASNAFRFFDVEQRGFIGFRQFTQGLATAVNNKLCYNFVFHVLADKNHDNFVDAEELAWFFSLIKYLPQKFKPNKPIKSDSSGPGVVSAEDMKSAYKRAAESLLEEEGSDELDIKAFTSLVSKSKKLDSAVTRYLYRFHSLLEKIPKKRINMDPVVPEGQIKPEPKDPEQELESDKLISVSNNVSYTKCYGRTLKNHFNKDDNRKILSVFSEILSVEDGVGGYLHPLVFKAFLFPLAEIEFSDRLFEYFVHPYDALDFRRLMESFANIIESPNQVMFWIADRDSDKKLSLTEYTNFLKELQYVPKAMLRKLQNRNADMSEQTTEEMLEAAKNQFEEVKKIAASVKYDRIASKHFEFAGATKNSETSELSINIDQFLTFLEDPKAKDLKDKITSFFSPLLVRVQSIRTDSFDDEVKKPLIELAKANPATVKSPASTPGSLGGRISAGQTPLTNMSESATATTASAAEPILTVAP